MSHEVGKRIIREATPEERNRHATIREQIAQELPELKEWAKVAVARNRDRIAVGTVLAADEASVLEAIDDYATKHALPGRGAVVREALSQLLGIPIAGS